jgi:hypothetical protein
MTTLDDILKNVRGVAQGAYKSFTSGQSPMQYLAPKIVNPIADSIRGPVSPIPDYSLPQMARETASSLVRDVGNFIPDAAASMVRLSPAAQLYESSKIIPKLDLSKSAVQNVTNPSNLQKIQDYQNVLRKQQTGDIYNATKAIGMIPGGLGAAAPAAFGAKAITGKLLQEAGGGLLNTGINAVMNEVQRKDIRENFGNAFSQGATTAGQMALVNQGVGAIFPKFNMPAKVNPNVYEMYGKINKFKTMLPSLERIAGKTLSGGVEGAALGAMQPLEEGQSRLGAITQNAALGAGMNLFGQATSEASMQTIGKMKQYLTLSHSLPEKDAQNKVMKFIADEGKRFLTGQKTAKPGEDFYYSDLRRVMGKPENGDYFPKMQNRPGFADFNAKIGGQKLPLTEAVKPPKTAGTVQDGTPLPLEQGGVGNLEDVKTRLLNVATLSDADKLLIQKIQTPEELAPFLKKLGPGGMAKFFNSGQGPVKTETARPLPLDQNMTAPTELPVRPTVESPGPNTAPGASQNTRPLTDILPQKGKLNVSKLKLTPEEQAQIRTSQEKLPVTTIGNKEVVKQAEMVTSRKTSMTDEEQKILLAKATKSRQEVVSAEKLFTDAQAKGVSEQEKVKLFSKVLDQSRVATSERTFAGRLLQVGNIMADEAATPMQRILASLEAAGVPREKFIKDAIKVDWNNGASVTNFYRKFVPPKFGEILTEFRYTNMLSSPQTHITNFGSNFGQTGVVVPIQKTITGALDWVKSTVTGSERQYYASQGIDYTKAYWSKLPQAWTVFKKAIKGADVNLKPDMERIPLGTKGAMHWYTTPLRALEGMDQFFKTLTVAGETASLKRAGITGPEALTKAEQFAEYSLFRQKFDPKGELGQGIVLKTWDKWNTAVKHLRNAPGGNWIVPFIQTPTNILKQGLEYSPFGVSTMIGAKEPMVQLSKAIIGTGVFMGAYSLADKGLTTWGLPTNPKERELFYAAGLQPYSIKIGDKWVSYSKLGPMSYPIAMAAAAKWVEKNNPDQSVVEKLQNSIMQTLGFFGDQSYMKSLGDVIDAVKGGSGMLKNIISSQGANFAGQLVPYRSFMGWITRIVDPTYRNADTFSQQMSAQIPGLSTSVPAYKDIQGNDSKRDFPLLNSILPGKVTQEKSENKAMYDTVNQTNIDNQVQNRALKELEQSGGQGETKTLGDKYLYIKDGAAKTLDLSKVSKMSTATPYDKVKQKEAAFALVDEAVDLPPEKQAEVLKKLGISQPEADYYNIAKSSSNQRYAYIQDKATSMEKIVPFLITVNGKKIASTDIITRLYDDGTISKEERTYLNALEWDEANQKFKLSRSYKTSQGAAAAAKAKAKLKALSDIAESEMKAKVDLAKPSQKLAPYRTLDSVLKKRSPSTTGLDSVLSMYRQTADQVRHLKKKVG